MTVINTSPNKLIQIGYEGEDKVTILRFSYSEKWLENGEGIFTVRVLRNGENQAYNAQSIKDDRENYTINMTVTDVELSKKGYGEMQLVYTGADFVKKSPVYKYYVSRSVDDVVDPPEGDVYTQIIESLADLRVDFNELSDMVSEINDDIGDLTELTTANKLNIVESINEVNAKGFVSVDDELSDVSTNPVQNKVIASRITSAESAIASAQTAIQGKADIQTVSALSDAVNGLGSDVQGLQMAVQSKADVTTVTALSGTVSGLQTAVQGKADTSTVTALSGTVNTLQSDVSELQTDKANQSDFDDLSGNVATLWQTASQYMTQTETALSGLQTTKADKSYVDTQLAAKASTQTVSDLSDDVSDLQTGLAGKVGDVQINGTSVVTNGVANVPKANESTIGVVMTKNALGTAIANNGGLAIVKASSSEVKLGTSEYHPVSPINQHLSAFYGLSKVAGVDEKNSTLPVGTYSEEAKIAIQKMLGIYEAPWELINEETFTNETSANYGINTDSNGDALELTDAILLFETPKQETQAVFGGSGSIRHYFKGTSAFLTNECTGYTQASNADNRGCVSILEQNKNMLHLSRISSATVSNNGTYGSRYGGNFGNPLGVGDRVSYLLLDEPIYIVRIVILAVTGTGHYRLYGKRKWQ